VQPGQVHRHQEHRPVLRWGPIGQPTRLRLQEWTCRLPRPPSIVREFVGGRIRVLEIAVEDGRLRTNPARGQATEDRQAGETAPDARPDRSIGLGGRPNARWSCRRLRDCRAHSGTLWPSLGELSRPWVRDFDARRHRLIVRQTVVGVRARLSAEAPKDYKSSAAFPFRRCRAADGPDTRARAG
jgi:hypothetical protein